MKPEKRRLIHDLLDDPDGEMRREATLLAGRRLLRHKRWRRTTTRSFAVVVGILIVTIFIHPRTTSHPRNFSATPPPAPPVHYLTDEQLLALFPDTPVGLATIGKKKVLIFPRPGDKERFMGQF